MEWHTDRVRRRICAALLVLVVAWPVAATSQDHAKNRSLDCTECHTCQHPSPARPCLRSGLCPRHEAMAGLAPDLGPDVVVLDGLENLYDSVRFDHAAHARMVRFSGGCETCHHFTPPDAEHPACKDCHPAEISHEDIAQPGLKGAYHRNCMSCHSEWDTDTACEVCHEKKGASSPPTAREHARYRPIVLEELIVFDTEYEEGDQVPFHHRNHSVLYERDCTECHEEQGCQRCHVQGQKLHPMGEPSATDLHDTCFRCHHEERCEDCHGRAPDDLFTHRSTGWPLKEYHAGLRCRSCHGQRGAFMKLEPRCDTCHPGGWDAGRFRHAVTGVVLDETHLEADCGDCHAQGMEAGVTCDACHDDARVYAPATGFLAE